MKTNDVFFVIAVAISGLLTFGLWSIEGNTLKNLMTVGAFIFMSSTLGLLLGVSFSSARTGVNIRVVSGLFFIIGIVINLVFAFGTFSQTSYVITNGVAFLIFILIARSIYMADQ